RLALRAVGEGAIREDAVGIEDDQLHARGGFDQGFGDGRPHRAEVSRDGSKKKASARGRRFTTASISTSVVSSSSMASSGHMLGPSEGARSGSGWVSMKIPATPAPTAARASTGTIS